MRLLTLLLLFFITMTPLSFAQSGKLDKVKESLSSGSGSSSNNSDSSDNGYDDYSDGESFGDALLFEVGYLFVRAAGYITYGLAVEAPGEYETLMHTADLAPYPYYKKGQGEYTVTDGDQMKIARFELSYNYLRESTKFAGHQLKFETRFARRFAVEASYINFIEDSPNLDEDRLGLASLMFNYYRVRTEKLSLWWGIGGTHVGNGVNRTGFSYQIGAKLFVADPVSFETSIKQSFVNSQTINQFRLLGKYHYKNYSLSGGYEYFKLGSVDANMLSVGVGVSF